MLRKLIIDIKVEAQASDDSPLAPLVTAALQEFIDQTTEHSAMQGKFESKEGLDITWSARNEYFDDLGNQVHVDPKPVSAAVSEALRPKPKLVVAH